MANADDFNEADLGEFEKFGSKTALKKANALVKGVRWLLAKHKKGKRAPTRLYLNTDSRAVVVEVDATEIDADVTPTDQEFSDL